jgi:hypothetical protein
MKSALEAAILAGLTRVFESEVSQDSGYAPVAAAQWAKLADAISDIAVVIVLQITTTATVAPGQLTAKGDVTVTPGVIL